MDVTALCGVDFRHDGGRSGRMILADTVGSGGTLFDADGDGDLDLYLVTGNALTGRSRGARNALFVNDGGGGFSRAVPTGGIDAAASGHGALSFDADGDGRIDLYVTNRGKNRLYRNLGELRFEDVTDRAGVGDERWSTSAAAADYDRDGDLDLYVANYLEFDPLAPIAATTAFGTQVYRGPMYWDGQPDVLYRNGGDGTFSDVTKAAGVLDPNGKGLGVAFVDLDSDGWPDLFVANDLTPNPLYRNLRNGRFQDVGEEAGVAVGPIGMPEASMGVAVGDYDGDALPDIHVTNFEGESNALWRNLGGLVFERTTSEAGLVEASVPMLGFGTDFIDPDLDGDLDLLVVNGHVMERPELFSPTTATYPMKQQLYLSDGRGRFRDAMASAGAFFDRKVVGRGSLPGDLDGDGDLDLVITVNDGPAVVLQNTAGAGRERSGSYLRVLLAGRAPNVEAVGAKVELRGGGKRQVRFVMAGSSYLCDADGTPHFGLGAEDRVESLDVTWPSGRKSTLRDVPANQTLRVAEPAE